MNSRPISKCDFELRRKKDYLGELIDAFHFDNRACERTCMSLIINYYVYNKGYSLILKLQFYVLLMEYGHDFSYFIRFLIIIFIRLNEIE